MSNIFGPIIGDVGPPAYALITSGYQRSIGTILPDVVIDEIHRDEMQITQHPVELGAPVSDHAFKMPPMIEMRACWSDSSAQAAGYVQEVYQALLALQVSRQPFNVSTGKRQYSNMLFRLLLVRTDETSEFALMTIAVAQQVLLTSATTTSAAAPNTNGSTPHTAPPGQGGIGSDAVAGGTASATSFPNSVVSIGTTQLTTSPGYPTLSEVNGVFGRGL